MTMDRTKASALSVATMLALVTATLSGGMYMGTLATEVSVLQQAIAEDNVREEKDLRNDRETDKKLERIEARQEAFAEDVDELKEDMDKQDEKLDQILKEIRKK